MVILNLLDLCLLNSRELAYLTLIYKQGLPDLLKDNLLLRSMFHVLVDK
jgi:hypothetical protein